MDNNDNIRISVITVCYNAAAYIEKTLQSVLAQTAEKVEYILVDGQSTDGTMEMIRRYGTRIHQVLSEPDKGIYQAMNKGVKMAHGEWVIFMNAGDVFCSPQTLDEILPYLQTDASLVYGNIQKKDKQGNIVIKPAEAPHNAHRMFFCHQALFCRTSLLRRFPFDEQYRLSADFKFVKSMWLQGEKFQQTPVSVALFDTSGVSNTNRSAGLRENIAIVKELDHFFEKWRCLSKLYFTLYWLLLRNSDNKYTKNNKNF